MLISKKLTAIALAIGLLVSLCILKLCIDGTLTASPEQFLAVFKKVPDSAFPVPSIK